MSGRRIKCRKCGNPVDVQAKRSPSAGRRKRPREVPEKQDDDTYTIPSRPDPKKPPEPLKRIRYQKSSASTDRQASTTLGSRVDETNDDEGEDAADDEMGSFALGTLNILAAGGVWVFFTWLESGGSGRVPVVLLAIYAWVGKNTMCGAWAALGVFVFLTGFLPKTDDQK
jgi:hypothetical protein